MIDVNIPSPSPAASAVDPPGGATNARATPAPPAPKPSAHDVLDGGSLPMRIAAPLPLQFEQSLQIIARK
jgi:hypothetical protein